MLKLLYQHLGSRIPKEHILLDMLTLEILEKILSKQLESFYRCRVQEDITINIKLPTKGSSKEVSQNEVDKKTNGPFLFHFVWISNHLLS